MGGMSRHGIGAPFQAERKDVRCIECGASAVSERSERTNILLNRVQYGFDVVALVVPWRLHYKLSPRNRSAPELDALPDRPKIGVSAAATRSNCRSVKRGPVRVTPIGIPADPSVQGRLMQGTCNNVHIRLNTALPGLLPIGASPGALGVSIASKGWASASKALRQKAAWSYAASSLARVMPSLFSTRE